MGIRSLAFLFWADLTICWWKSASAWPTWWHFSLKLGQAYKLEMNSIFIFYYLILRVMMIIITLVKKEGLNMIYGINWLNKKWVVEEHHINPSVQGAPLPITHFPMVVPPCLRSIDARTLKTRIWRSSNSRGPSHAGYSKSDPGWTSV